MIDPIQNMYDKIKQVHPTAHDFGNCGFSDCLHIDDIGCFCRAHEMDGGCGVKKYHHTILI